ncbi:MAG: ABC transporter substrate-binding protein [Acidobacteriia bacterium]|nr:ABC transporter substrate-binding protein [Terriglobia bacterium]
MKSLGDVKNTAFPLSGLLTILLLSLNCWIFAQARQSFSPQDRLGKQIYLKGEDGERGEINAVLGVGDLELPGTSFPCVNCHGPRGEGTSEGGLQPSPLTWTELRSPHTSPLTGHKRGPYNEATLARAISHGLDPGNLPLHPGMPHYQMSLHQMADLIAYLKKLGSDADVDSGLNDTIIDLGSVLPMTGPLAQAGQDVKATLNAYFTEINSQGGIYGRRFNLQVADSHGDAEGTLKATRKLVEEEAVFALIGSFEPSGSDPTNEYLRQKEVPLIGPTTLLPRPSIPPNPYVFYLLPTFRDQARVLVDFVHSRTKVEPPKLAVISERGEVYADALAGLKLQAKMYAMNLVFEEDYKPGLLSPSTVVKNLVAKQPEYVFAFGSADDVVALGLEMKRIGFTPPLLGSATLVGRLAFSLPPEIASNCFLSYPAAFPNREELEEFLSVLRKAKVELRSPAFQASAYAAAKIMVEVAKRSSRQITRAQLIQSMEKLRDFQTGVVPPVTFGPNRRVGCSGSYIVGIDLKNKRHVPFSEWMVPRDQP